MGKARRHSTLHCLLTSIQIKVSLEEIIFLGLAGSYFVSGKHETLRLAYVVVVVRTKVVEHAAVLLPCIRWTFNSVAASCKMLAYNTQLTLTDTLLQKKKLDRDLSLELEFIRRPHAPLKNDLALLGHG